MKRTLQEWFERWVLAESLSPGVEFDPGPSYDASGASLIIENGAATAQVIVWESGACDCSFGRFDGTVDDMEISSRVLGSADELTELVDALYLKVSAAD
jgi:hypothetical protein